MEKHLLQPSILTRERKFIVDSGASMHMMSKMVLSPENVETVRVSRLPTTVITANVSIDTTEKGPSLRERFGHIRHGPITSRHSRSAKSGKLCEEGGYSYEWKEDQNPSLIKNCKIVLCKCDNSVLIVVPGVSSDAAVSRR